MDIIDNMLPFNLKTAGDVALELRDRFRRLRLDLNLSRSGLSDRSGVNVNSLKRFEDTGRISLESLLKLALALGVLDDFDNVAVDTPKSDDTRTLDEIIATDSERRRGRGK